jgi:hypothetical protein
MTFPEWLKRQYRGTRTKFADNRFGDLAKNLSSVMNKNPFEESFEEYNSLTDWLEHLDTHYAPDVVRDTMSEAWDLYIKSGAKDDDR